MPNLDLTAARTLLIKTVENLYATRHSPIPGALAKAQLMNEAAASGSIFNERALGYGSFLHFIKAIPEVAVQIRPGSDVLLAPAIAGDILSAYASPLPRLRRDFWRAFIEFPVPESCRIYDPLEDKIFYERIPPTRNGMIIEPVSRQDQIAWRQNFAEEQAEPTRQGLIDSLSGIGTSVFNQFARKLRENPSLMQAWNRYLQKKITDYARSWGISNNVSEQRFLSGISSGYERASKEAASVRPHSLSQRSELYNFFDHIPIEDLLQLRVPLDWVLQVAREQK